MKNNIPEKLQRDLENVAKLLSEAKDYIRIVSHYDADGICANGILCNTLLRMGKRIHTTVTRKIDKEFIDKLEMEKNKITLFCDMGTSDLDMLEKIAKDNTIVILDHHKPPHTELKGENMLQVNPHFANIEGTYECSAATLLFLLSTKLCEKNWDLFYLALAGSIGDRQNIGGLKGLNKYVLDTAIEQKWLRVIKGYFEKDMSIYELLGDNFEPFYRNLTGRDEKITELLSRLGIPKDIRIIAMAENKKRLLVSILLLKLLNQGVTPDTIEYIFRDKYWLPDKNIYVDELAYCINACGRMGYENIGMAVCFGDMNALETAKKIKKEYTKRVINSLIKLEEGVKVKNRVQYFYTEQSTIAGTEAELALTYLLDKDKPVLAFTKLDKITKVSARATDFLVKKGVDLASACRIAGEEVGGKGGGHIVAGGAIIPNGKEDAFLEMFDEIIERQLKNKGAM